MKQEDITAVCDKMTLKDVTLWSIPIVRDVDEKDAERVKKAGKVLLTYMNKPLAICEVEDVFKYERMKMAEAILGTTCEKHSGVSNIRKHGKYFYWRKSYTYKSIEI